MAPKKLASSSRKGKEIPMAVNSSSSEDEPMFRAPKRRVDVAKSRGKATAVQQSRYFKSDKAKERYEEIFSQRALMYGKAIDFDYFASNNLDLDNFFGTLGWSAFLRSDGPCYYELVAQFYANMETLEDGTLITFVKGVDICVSKALLASVYNLPVDLQFMQMKDVNLVQAISRVTGQEGNLEISKMSANSMPPLSRLLHHIVTRCIRPRSGRYDAITKEQVFLVYCLLTNTPVSLPKIMVDLMKEVISCNRILAYGIPLTKLFQFCKVDLKNESVGYLEPTEVLNATTLHLMHLDFVDGQLVNARQQAPRPQIQGEFLPFCQAISESLNSLHMKVDQQTEGLDRLEENQRQIEENLAWFKGYFEK